MAEEKKKKDRVAKDYKEGTVTIAGEVYRLTTTDQAIRNHLAIDGFSDNITDAPAGMTLKAGFSAADRTARRREVEKNINAGVFRTAKTGVVNVEKAVEKIGNVAKDSTKLTDKEKAELAKLLTKMAAKG